METDVLLSALGLTTIITVSFAFKWFREKLKPVKLLYKFINCSQCVGFWTGCLLSYLNNDNLKIIVFTGFTSSIIGYTWILLMKYFIKKYD